MNRCKVNRVAVNGDSVEVRLPGYDRLLIEPSVTVCVSQ